MTQKVNWKAVQDRYKHLRDDFDAEDARNNNLSGVAGGEMGELYQALLQMQEERDTFSKEKKVDRTEKSKREEEKELMGRSVVDMALRRKREREDEEQENSVGTEDADGPQISAGTSGNGCSEKKKRKKQKNSHVNMAGDLVVFGEHLQEAYMARVKLQSDQLEFEKERYMRETEQREGDRVERQEEFEAAKKLKLEKFKIMFDTLKQQRKDYPCNSTGEL